MTEITIADCARVLAITPRAARAKLGHLPHTLRSRAGRGGKPEKVYALADLPGELQDLLLPLLIGAPAPNDRSAPATSVPTAVAAVARTSALAQWQIDAARARLAFVAEVERLSPVVGKERAIRSLERMAKAGELPEALASLVPVANVRAGTKGRALSRARLHAWCSAVRGVASVDLRISALAPKGKGRKWEFGEDVLAVLALKRSTTARSLAACVREVAGEDGAVRSSLEHRCRRALRMLPAALMHAGSHTGAALKALQPFRRREFLSLAPNDVWVGDGHGAKLKVAHPITGNPFVPEVTAILDVGTRYCVGWSVSFSENCIAVSDALRHAVSRHGVPLVYYSDNGGGQKNKMFDAPVTGTLGALGIHHDTGTPGNPQGRGVIERFWQTVLMPLAARFATYHGKGADRDTLKNVTREIDRALRAAKRDGVVALPRKLPTWAQFIAALDEAMEAYNQAHRHSSLPRLDGASHATPAEYRAARIAQAGGQIHRPSEEELAVLFMPAEVRRAVRGEVRILNGLYYHRDLYELADGEDVQVCYDIHDNSRVWVKRLSGEFIACAVLDGNRTGYEPQPLVDKLRERRARGRIKRASAVIEEAQAELEAPALIEQVPGHVLQPFPAEPDLPLNVRTLPVDPEAPPEGADDLAFARWMLDHPARVQPHHREWLADEMRASPTFRSMVEDEEIARGLRAPRRVADGDEDFQVAAG